MAPHVGSDIARVKEARRWLADVVAEQAESHSTVESLRNAAVYRAVREALLRK
ncbi:MAG TPA: hypothetical protein VET25_10110 [Aestuariivirgaceae bacterium]|nr:hypothetical protein [Aestuariivirgaceae bacterium]